MGVAPLRVGLLGCGRVASSVHLPVLASLPGATLVALAEPDAVLKQAACRLVPEAMAFDDFRELLRRAAVDAVVVALPNALHAPATIDALDKGLHVYVEKPLALDADEGAQVIDCWRRSGRIGMIGYNYRFHPQYVDARRLLQQGRLGSLVMLRGLFTSSSPETPGWKRARSTGGGALLDLVSHHLDLACWLTGEAPASVACRLVSRRTEDDTAVVQVEFPSKVVAQLAAGLEAGNAHRFEIVGERGTLTLEPYHAETAHFEGAQLGRPRLDRWIDATRALVSLDHWMARAAGSQGHASYREALRTFLGAVADGRQPDPDLQVGQDTMIWLSAAAAAAHRGDPVRSRDGSDLEQAVQRSRQG